MGYVSFWACAVILLCAGGITYGQRYPHEPSPPCYRNYKAGYGNAPQYSPYEGDYDQPVPPAAPPPPVPPPPVRSYAREIYQSQRVPPPGPKHGNLKPPCSEYEEDDYPYTSDEPCPCGCGEGDCPCACEQGCPCDCQECANSQCPCENEDYPCPCGSGSEGPSRGSHCPCACRGGSDCSCGGCSDCQCSCCSCCGKGGGCPCERCSCSCGRANDYPSGDCPCCQCERCPCECSGCDEPDYPEEPVQSNSRNPPSYSEYYPIPEKRGRSQMNMRYGSDRYSESYPPSPMMPPPPPPPPQPMMAPPPPPPVPIPSPPPPAPIPSYPYSPQYSQPLHEDPYRHRPQMIVTVSKTYGSPGQLPPGPESHERMMSSPQITEQSSYPCQMSRHPEMVPRMNHWRPPPPPIPRRAIPDDSPYPEHPVPSYGRRGYHSYSRSQMPPVGDGRTKPSYLDGLSYAEGC